MKYSNWRFIRTGYADAYTNMALDEAIMTACLQKLVPPTLRLYGWKPAAVSIGYFQKLHNAVNIQTCSRLGINVVRRLTGGRAVLHQHEVTYSVIIREDYPQMPRTVVDSYRFISKGIIEGLRFLGAEVTMESGRDKARGLDSSACFDSASMYEVLFEGRKVVGSAQVRKDGVILQHGSILIEVDINKQAAVMSKSPVMEEKLEGIFRNKVTTLKKILGRQLEFAEIEEAIFKGFEKAFDMRGILGELTDMEKALKSELIPTYSSQEWLGIR